MTYKLKKEEFNYNVTIDTTEFHSTGKSISYFWLCQSNVPVNVSLNDLFGGRIACCVFLFVVYVSCLTKVLEINTERNKTSKGSLKNF